MGIGALASTGIGLLRSDETLPAQGWQLTVSVGMPIYDGGLRYGLLKERRTSELRPSAATIRS